jgi:TatD DNase family protein
VNIPFIDIHTHHAVFTEKNISVQSLFLQCLDLKNEIHGPFTTAIHPWHSEGFTSEQVNEMLSNLINQSELIAIGETGLDKACNAYFGQQKLIFELHLDFAQNHHIPMVIHCVKAWNELIVYLKVAKVPIILHGYSSAKELTRQLLDLGCYFSFGKRVFNSSPRFRESMQIIPPASLFIETDDSGANIQDIYLEVSKIIDIPLQELKIQINNNFNNLFFK